jgi:hypothetical protein
MSIPIEQYRREIEEKYIGFKPNTEKVKPVHIANGMFRSILGKTADTREINRFVIYMSQRGTSGVNTSDALYEDLVENNKITRLTISKEQVAEMRRILKKVVAADDGVFTNGMESYSAAFEGFVSRDRIAQDGGEFVGTWLSQQGTSRQMLGECIGSSLRESGDIITVLMSPLLNHTRNDYTPPEYSSVILRASNIPNEVDNLWKELSTAANTLSKHLSSHPNKLVRMQSAVLFSCYVLVRHLACLENYHVNGCHRGILPFLIDFSTSSQDAVARASTMTYTLICQSISRFYAWAFAEKLRLDFNSINEVLKEPTPTYSQGSQANRQRDLREMDEIWRTAQIEARNIVASNSGDPFEPLGQAIYDLMLLKANASPIQYLRQLGRKIGLLWPPNQPVRRFRIQQELLEVLIRGAVEPGEPINLNSLQDRLWDRYGIIIGGRLSDEERLLNNGIYQADSDALKENCTRFVECLNNLSFARLMADGVLMIKLEGYGNES